MNKTLIVITGPTASGKTEVAVEVASQLGCEVISADSRQIYRDIPIASAAPSVLEMKGIKHHFIGTHGLHEHYSSGKFENDVLRLLPNLWEKNDYTIMVGGSMMYIDAVTDGTDDIPPIPSSTREYVDQILRNNGSEALIAQLEILDPEYASQVDLDNIKRVAHAVEISLTAGCPYSSLRLGTHKPRDFNILKFAIDIPRAVLFERINSRVIKMMDSGLLEEARRLYPFRNLNALNTVGLKELFDYFENKTDLATAISKIQKNTRIYSKKQTTWLKRPDIRPAIPLQFPDFSSQILHLLK